MVLYVLLRARPAIATACTAFANFNSLPIQSIPDIRRVASAQWCAHAVVNSHLPFELDARDPNFARECLSWSFQTQCEIQELIAGTKLLISNSRALMVEADHIFARVG